jgi:fatty-acyl-CoA synthase
MAFAGVKDASVYGIAVPGTEGAAGMAALVADGDLNLPALRQHLARRLPPYARPLFLRIADRIDVTATFKHKKAELVREGFDPAKTDDVIYFDDLSQRSFVRLDDELYDRIAAGEVRL